MPFGDDVSQKVTSSQRLANSEGDDGISDRSFTISSVEFQNLKVSQNGSCIEGTLDDVFNSCMSGESTNTESD